MLADSDDDLMFEPIKLGKNIEMRYIPFSELAIPWKVCLNAVDSRQENRSMREPRFSSFKQANPKNPKATKILKHADLDALKRSIAQYGLLKPLEVAEMHERLDFFYGKARYLIIDGQRRYFAIRALLKLPTEEEEEERKENLRTGCDSDIIVKGEIQAQQQFDKLSIRDYVMIPCLVYPYTTLLQMVRHSIEDKRFSEKPQKEDFELADKMEAEGVNDLKSDNLAELFKTRDRIEEERHAIEKTLEEIRNRLKKEKNNDEAGI